MGTRRLTQVEVCSASHSLLLRGEHVLFSSGLSVIWTCPLGQVLGWLLHDREVRP